MLENITIGQYFATNSIIHRLDPRIKLLLSLTLIIGVFFIDSYLMMAISIFVCFAFMITSKIQIKMYLKMLKAILPIIIITSFLNIFYNSEGKTIFSYGIINITTGGIQKVVLISFRICLLIIFSSMLTYTTSPTELTDAIERLLSPLKFIGLGETVHILAMMTSIALRFIPILIEEVDKITSAQKARGADIESGNLLKRIKALIPILIPLLISATRRAYDLAEAMECRCYHGGKGRTKMKQLHLSYKDFIACAVIILFLCLIIFGKVYYTDFETTFINSIV